MDEYSSINGQQTYNLVIESSITDVLPSIVKEGLTKMPESKQSQFVEEFKRKRKSVGAAYLLHILLFMPYGYIGKWGLQFVFWITWGGFLFWWIFMLFALPNTIKDVNKDIAMEVFRDIKLMS